MKMKTKKNLRHPSSSDRSAHSKSPLQRADDGTHWPFRQGTSFESHLILRSCSVATQRKNVTKQLKRVVTFEKRNGMKFRESAERKTTATRHETIV